MLSFIREFVHDQTVDQERFLFTVCTGAALAAKAGVLDSKMATTNKVREGSDALRKYDVWLEPSVDGATDWVLLNPDRAVEQSSMAHRQAVVSPTAYFLFEIDHFLI